MDRWLRDRVSVYMASANASNFSVNGRLASGRVGIAHELWAEGGAASRGACEAYIGTQTHLMRGLPARKRQHKYTYTLPLARL